MNKSALLIPASLLAFTVSTHGLNHRDDLIQLDTTAVGSPVGGAVASLVRPLAPTRMRLIDEEKSAEADDRVGEDDASLHLAYGEVQFSGVVVGDLQQMVGEAGGGLRADSRQARELSDEP